VEIPENSILALHSTGLVVGRGRNADTGRAALGRGLAQPDRSLTELRDDIPYTVAPERDVDDDATLLLARTGVLGEDRVAVWTLPDDPPWCRRPAPLSAASSPRGISTTSSTAPNWSSANWSPTPPLRQRHGVAALDPGE
jgi:hypothetical protein